MYVHIGKINHFTIKHTMLHIHVILLGKKETIFFKPVHIIQFIIMSHVLFHTA